VARFLITLAFVFLVVYVLLAPHDPVRHELTKHIGVYVYYTRAQV
jgi:hypothetical protein